MAAHDRTRKSEKEGISLLKQQFETEPTEEVVYDLCCYLTEAGMMEQATMLLKQLLEREPELVWAHTLLGKCLGELGRHKEALEALWQALDINTNLIDARFHAGLTAKHLGDYSQALSHFREVILLNTKDARAYNLLGECCARLGKIHDAKLFFAQARRLAPDFQEPLDNLKQLWSLEEEPAQRAATESAVRADSVSTGVADPLTIDRQCQGSSHPQYSETT